MEIFVFMSWIQPHVLTCVGQWFYPYDASAPPGGQGPNCRHSVKRKNPPCQISRVVVSVGVRARVREGNKTRHIHLLCLRVRGTYGQGHWEDQTHTSRAAGKPLKLNLQKSPEKSLVGLDMVLKKQVDLNRERPLQGGVGVSMWKKKTAGRS